jgi:hypothetical protein
VNVASGDWRGGDDFPPGMVRKDRCRSLCTEGKLRRAGTHCGEARWRTSGRPERVGKASGIGGNVVNPTVGSALQYTCTDREEEAGEVVQNHGAGTWTGSGFPAPKEWTAGQPEVEILEWTPWRPIRRRGDLWTTPREEARTTGLASNEVGNHVGKCRQPTGVRVAGPGRVGTDGAKVKRVKRRISNR